MRTSKRILVLIVLVSVMILSACMGNSNPTHNEDGQVIVRLGKQTSTNPKLPEGDTFEDNAYSRLAEELLDIELVNEFEANGEDYERQVALAISSGELPDIMQVSLEELKELKDNDLIADLSEVYEEHASPFIKELYDSYEINPLDDVTFDGELYGIPAAVNVTAPNMVWVRQDWLDELQPDFDSDGDYFVTLDELERLAMTFIENDPDNTGNPIGMALSHWFSEPGYGSTFTANAMASAKGAYPKNWMFDGDGNVTYGSLAPEMKETLALANDWFERGILDPQFGTRSWDDIMALLVNGELGIATGAWHIPDWGLSNVKEMIPDVEFSAFTVVDDKGLINVPSQNPRGTIAVVRKDFENPEILMDLVNLFYDTLKNEPKLEEVYPSVYEYQVLDVDGAVRPLNMEIMRSTSELDDYKLIKQAVNGDIDVSEISEARSRSLVSSIMEYKNNPEEASTAAWALYHSRMKGLELGERALESGLVNWENPAFFGSTPAIEQYYGNLSSMEEEEFIKIVTGVEPLDYFDVFVENWYNQGGTEILTEIEEAINQ